MFGFPFLTSLIVTILLAIVFSLILNRGFSGTLYSDKEDDFHYSGKNGFKKF